MMRPARLFPQRMVKVELTEGICELVAAGYGVSILSRWAVAPYVEQGRLKAVRLQDGACSSTGTPRSAAPTARTPPPCGWRKPWRERLEAPDAAPPR